MENPVASPRVYRFESFSLDSRTGELIHRGARTPLREQPLQLLLVLLEHPGDLVTREQLVKRLWPAGTFVDFDRGLNKAINHLREALGDSAEHPQFIETFPRRGYRFIAPVTHDGHDLEDALPQKRASPLEDSLLDHLAGSHTHVPGNRHCECRRRPTLGGSSTTTCTSNRCACRDPPGKSFSRSRRRVLR